MPKIDDLSIEISASANKANVALDNLISKLSKLSTSLSTINSSKFDNLANGVDKLALSMQNMNAVKTSDFTRLAKNLDKLGNVNASKIVHLSTSLQQTAATLNGLGNVSDSATKVTELANAISRLGGKTVTQATSNLPTLSAQLQNFLIQLNGIGALSFDTTSLANLTALISRLGGKSVNTAITNLPILATQLKSFFQVMSTSPRVSNNIIQMTNALANLANQGRRVGTASNQISKGLNKVSASSTKANKSARSLASAFGKFYANCFLIIRGIKALGKSIQSSMDYIETFNYFEAAFEQVTSSVDLSAFEELGDESAETYKNSFIEATKAVTSELSGFDVGENGKLTESGNVSLGIDPNQVLNYQSMYAQMASSMGVAAENSTRLSEVMTKLGADLASVKNMDFDKVWTDMASGMAGMSRTMDKFGVNIRNVNLQQKLLDLGINKNITNLNQQDKALLRTIITLDTTRYAWADMSDTIQQPANQLRLLKSNFNNLSREIGNIFLPIVSKVLPYVNGLAIALQRLATFVKTSLGFEKVDMGALGGGATDNDLLSTIKDEADEATNSLENAEAATKALKNQLMGFDEMNKLSDNAEATSGAADKGLNTIESDILSNAFEDISNEYLSVWDKTYQQVENRAQNIATRIQEVFSGIGQKLEPTTQALTKLWNNGLKPFVDFTAQGVIDFYNSFLAPIGTWTFNEAIPRLAGIVENFLSGIDWTAANEMFNNAFGFLAEILTDVGDVFLDIAERILPLLTPILNDLISIINNILVVLRPVWDYLKTYIIPFLADTFVGLIQTAIHNIGGVIHSIKLALEGIVNFVSGIFSGDWDKAWKGIGQITEGAFNFIKTVFMALPTYLNNVIIKPVANHISRFWQGIKDITANAWNGILGLFSNGGKIFSGVVDGISGVFKRIVNVMIKGINNVIKIPFDGINKLLNGIRNVGVLGIKPFQGLWGENPLKIPVIPQFKVGGFPEDGLFFANHTELVGKFSNGQTAVANNEQITKGIANAVFPAVYGAVKQAMSENQSNTTVKIEGDPNGMFRVMQQQAENYVNMTGLSPFPV